MTIDQVSSDAFPTVEASVSILSSQGMPIKGLTSGDISAIEDGQPVIELQVTPRIKKHWKLPWSSMYRVAWDMATIR